MALAASVATVLDDIRAMDEVAIRDLYKQLKGAWAIAHASGLATVTWTLPTGITRTIAVPEALQALTALQALIGADEGGIVFQTAELP
jgi:hypothetical protein